MAASEGWGGVEPEEQGRSHYQEQDLKSETGLRWSDGFRPAMVPQEGMNVAKFRARPAAAMAAPLRPPLKGSVASLQGLCLGCIGEHIEEFLQCGTHAVALLTAEQRSALASIARRRGLLYGPTLEALVDPGWVMLDLSGGAKLCDAVFLTTLGRLRSLQALDISRCDSLTVMSLRALPDLCPQLTHLRLGGSQLSTACAIKALKHLIPRVQAIEEDSWEDVADISISNGLQLLETLFWADIPRKQREYVFQNCPKVMVHSHDSCVCTTPLVCSERQKPCCWPALDLPLAEAIGPAAWRALHRTADALRKAPVPIAQKFKMAIDEQEAQMAARAEKKLRQQKNRQARLNPDVAALEMWLDKDGGVLV